MRNITASSFKLLFAILTESPQRFLVRHFDIWCFATASHQGPLLSSPGRIFSYSVLILIQKFSTINWQAKARLCQKFWALSTCSNTKSRNKMFEYVDVDCDIPTVVNGTILLWHSFSQSTLLCVVNLFNFKLWKLEGWFFIWHIGLLTFPWDDHLRSSSR